LSCLDPALIAALLLCIHSVERLQAERRGPLGAVGEHGQERGLGVVDAAPAVTVTLGVNVVITILKNFRQFSAKKLRFS
jgi:hypothetical protein